MSLCPFVRSKPACTGQILAAFFALCAIRGEAATWTWGSGSGAWSSAGNWVPSTVPVGAASTVLVFGGSGATAYTASHDLGTSFDLNRLILQSSASGTQTLNSPSGHTLDFSDQGPLLASILQNGSGAFVLNVGITGDDQIQFGGTGAGKVHLAGAISADSGLNFVAGNWRLSNNTNTFQGVLSLRAGALLELLPLSGPTILNRSSGLLGLSGGGSRNEVMIDGGTLKVSTNGASDAGGHMRFGTGGASFRAAFGTGGGTLDLTNGNPAQPGVHAGTIGYYNGTTAVSGGDLALTLNNTAPAVVKFNGGEIGFSTLDNAQSQSGDWNIGQNALRFNSFTGSGPLRIELTNGALSQAGTGAGDLPPIAAPTTYRGVAGGDPTSGVGGFVNASLSLTTGRLGFNRSAVTYTNGLRLEDALQVSAVMGAARIAGGITVAGDSGGHPGFVTFTGRAGPNSLDSTPVAPTGNTTGQNPLWLGTSATTALAIERGGKAVFDARVRRDQSNHSGVYLEGRAVLRAGGLLQISQSLSNFFPVPAVVANVGDIILHGPIEGNGNSVDEAVLDLRLPKAQLGGKIADGFPLPLPVAGGMSLLIGARPFGALDAEDGHQIIINGSGFGGLRVEANPRPNGLFSGGVADPTPNVTKLTAYLTSGRLAGITGSGGYLTGAPTGQTWNFPVSGEWLPGVPVGLRVTNHHPSGVDVDLSALTSFQHNLVVDAGATLDLGSVPFSYGPSAPSAGLGTLHGKGTILAPGGLSVTVGGSIAPGTGDIGALTVDRLALSGRLEVEGSVAATDVLRVVGDLVLGATTQLAMPAGTVLGPRNYRIVSADTSAGTFGSTSGLPATHTVSYSRPGEVWLSYMGGQSLTWRGNVSAQWNLTTQNWSTPATFQDGDRVVFDDSVTGSLAVTLSNGDVAPASVLVNSAGNYSIISSLGAALTGTGALIKTGAGTLTLSGPASFEGGILAQQGILQTTAPDSIPDVGKVVIDAGAQLNLGGAERINELIVSGSVAASAPLTVETLRLQGATSFQAPLILENKLVKSGAPLSLAQSINLAGGVRLVQVAASTSPELTVAGAITNGGLEKTGPGTLVLAGANAFPDGITIRDGTLRPAVAGAIPANTNVTLSGGTLDLNAIPHSLGSLNTSGTVTTGGASLAVTSLSGTGGTIELGAGALQVTQDSTTRYDGNITTTGGLTKLGSGSLALGGTNSISGGTQVTEGYLRIVSPTAATIGTITVNPSGILVAGDTISAPVVLAGGTLGSRYEEPAITGDLTAAAGTTSMIRVADPEELTFDSEVVIHGRLRGSGDLLVLPSPNGEGADRNQGMRLRGTAPSDFSGTITLSQGVKMELQSSVGSPFSPAGSGRIVLTAGTISSSRRGTYSQLNLRNNFAGDITLGNDVEVVGAGLVNFGPVSDSNALGPIAPNRSKIILGNLRIGGGQIAAVNKNTLPAPAVTPSQTVQFSTVTLTGGDVGFAPETSQSGFSFRSDLALGPISETAPSSLLMFGKSNLYLRGANSYTGRTEVSSGTIWLGAAGALPSTTSLILLNDGKVDFQNRDGTSFSQTVASLTGDAGTLITNTAADFVRTLTITQATDTVFAGRIEGGLNVVKTGPGKLSLTGVIDPAELITVSGGVLSLSNAGVNGTVAGSVAVQAGGTLTGTGTIDAITVASGGRLEPGDQVGQLYAGMITLQGGATAAFNLNGDAEITEHDLITSVGTIALNGLVDLELNLGYQPAFMDELTLILNDSMGMMGGGGRFVYNGNTLENLERFTVASGGFEQLFEIRYDAVRSEDGVVANDVILTAVPEPGSVVLLLAGAVMCVRRRRK